jgi:hypothetical protein
MGLFGILQQLNDLSSIDINDSEAQVLAAREVLDVKETTVRRKNHIARPAGDIHRHPCGMKKLQRGKNHRSVFKPPYSGISGLPFLYLLEGKRR